MTHLLDTNACVRYLNGRAASVRNKLATMPPGAVGVCSVVKAEMYAGAMKSANPVRTRSEQQAFLVQFISLPFDDAAASVYAVIRTHLANAGTLIGPYDLQIAAIALANNLVLVTHNTREFSRVPGLLLEDWET
jgi:tRNA(fMet)-specific endonuclease VapC